MNDGFGIDIRVGDRVRVKSYGYGARLADCGRVGVVKGFARSRVVVDFGRDEVANIGGVNLGILRRDGSGDGYLANQG